MKGEEAAGSPLLTPQGSPAFLETVRGETPEWDLNMGVSVRSPWVLALGTVSAAGAEGLSSCLEAEVGGCDEGGRTGEHPQVGGGQAGGGSPKEKSQLQTPRLTAPSTACVVKPFLFPFDLSQPWL